VISSASKIGLISKYRFELLPGLDTLHLLSFSERVEEFVVVDIYHVF
jgi:hypothetical protein